MADYTLYHTIKYNGKMYIFDPFTSHVGMGGWRILHERSGKPGINVSKELERILNKIIFGKEELPNMLERYDQSTIEGKKRFETIAMSWLQMKIKGIRPAVKDVFSWTTDQPNYDVEKFTGVSDTTHFRPGRLYFYVYDAKLKDILPIWDMFPLTLVLETYTNKGNYEPGFLGLNLHYVDIDIRQKILEDILPKGSIINTTLQINFGTNDIINLLRTERVRPCIKRYIFSHVRSRILPIQSHEWTYAIVLPVQKFVTNTRKK